jgi:hypothetical protein
MEKRLRRLTRRLATALVALALVGGWAANARADIAYAFAEQTISALSISPAGTPVGGVSTFTQDSSTVNGSGISNSATLDAPQAYQGGAPPAPENLFTRYAPGSPPVSPTTPADFTRGDVVIASLAAATNSSSVVAESYLNSATPKTETGNGGLGASFSFRPTTAGPLTITYSYSNDIFAFTTGSGSASANYHFDITIKDAAGTVVFNSATPETNLSLSAPPQGGEIIRSGTQSVTSPSLLTTTNYTVIFSSTAQSSVAAVPEPDVVALVGAGGALTLAVGAARRRARRGVTS